MFKSFQSPYRPANTYTNYLYDNYRRINYIDEKALFWSLLAIAVLLMIVSSLIAGLILAISPLDITWLNVMSVTGSDKRRKRAQRVAQIRRRGTWFLSRLQLHEALWQYSNTETSFDDHHGNDHEFNLSNHHPGALWYGLVGISHLRLLHDLLRRALATIPHAAPTASYCIRMLAIHMGHHVVNSADQLSHRLVSGSLGSTETREGHV